MSAEGSEGGRPINPSGRRSQGHGWVVIGRYGTLMFRYLTPLQAVSYFCMTPTPTLSLTNPVSNPNPHPNPITPGQETLD